MLREYTQLYSLNRKSKRILEIMNQKDQYLEKKIKKFKNNNKLKINEI